MGDALLVILGWLFGTLTPGIAEAIKRPKRKAALARALRIDFDELCYKAALVANRMRARTGTMNQASLRLIRAVVEDFAGAGDDVDFKAFFKKALESGEASYIASQNTQKGQGSPYPVRYELPFLSAHLQDIELFDVPTQTAILRVRGEHHLFNEQVEQVRLFHERTFSPLSAQNYLANAGNYEGGLVQLATRAEELVRAINAGMQALGRWAR